MNFDETDATTRKLRRLDDASAERLEDLRGALSQLASVIADMKGRANPSANLDSQQAISRESAASGRDRPSRPESRERSRSRDSRETWETSRSRASRRRWRRTASRSRSGSRSWSPINCRPNCAPRGGGGAKDGAAAAAPYQTETELSDVSDRISAWAMSARMKRDMRRAVEYVYKSDETWNNSLKFIEFVIKYMALGGAITNPATGRVARGTFNTGGYRIDYVLKAYAQECPDVPAIAPSAFANKILPKLSNLWEHARQLRQRYETVPVTVAARGTPPPSPSASAAGGDSAPPLAGEEGAEGRLPSSTSAAGGGGGAAPSASPAAADLPPPPPPAAFCLRLGRRRRGR